MHYRRDPCSSQTLAPTKNILDCEFRDWIAAYHFHALVEQGCPSDISARRTNELLLGLMGRSGRQLWIEGHDAGTFRALEYHTDTFFHEDFVRCLAQLFGRLFLKAMTHCCHVGEVKPPRKPSHQNPAKTGFRFTSIMLTTVAKTLCSRLEAASATAMFVHVEFFFKDPAECK